MLGSPDLHAVSYLLHIGNKEKFTETKLDAIEANIHFFWASHVHMLDRWPMDHNV